MKNYAGLILICIGIALGINPLVAQDSTALCQNKKTFVIRKKDPVPSPNNTLTTVEVEKEKEPSLSINENTDKSDAKVAVSKITKAPTLAGGEFGLMRILPYQKGMDFKDWHYVALQYSVTVHGWATKVEILETNDERLKNIVLQELKKAKWNPALDADGNFVEHRMYPQAVVVKDPIYEEDYENRN